MFRGHVVVVVVVILIFWPGEKDDAISNWNFEFFFFLVFRVDWVNYCICREAGGRVIDVTGQGKLSQLEVGQQQAGHGKIFLFSLVFLFKFYLWRNDERVWVSHFFLDLVGVSTVVLFTIRDVLGEEGGGEPASSGSSVCPSPDLTCDVS